MILSENAMVWFVSFMILAICLIWLAWDGRNFVRFWSQRKERHDEFFASIMGLVCVAIGLTGLVRYYLSL